MVILREQGLEGMDKYIRWGLSTEEWEKESGKGEKGFR